MNQEKFIGAIKLAVRDASVQGVLDNFVSPVGKPSQRQLEVSKFYKRLKNEDKDIINEMVLEAVDTAIFGFLCIIDGVRSINDDENEYNLKLIVTNVEIGTEVVLNDPYEDMLHDIYNSEN